MMKDEFQAKVTKDSYMGNYNWIEEYYVEPTDGEMFEDIIKKYEGKKVKIIIQEIVEE